MKPLNPPAVKPVELLTPFVPPGCAEWLVNWLESNRAKLIITRKRISKFGDYRPPHRDPWHRITVNHNLNPYAFLVTLLHEMAHLAVWNKNKNNMPPHNLEWQKTFENLLAPFLEKNIFPAEIRQALYEHLSDIPASCGTDTHLMRILRNYDKPSQRVLIEQISYSGCFIYRKRRFRKNEKLRKNYRCTDLGSGRTYHFSPVAEVIKIQDESEPAIA